MEIPREDLERLMAIEQTRELAMAEYRRNPGDAENLTRLGRSLVELSQFAQGQDCNDMLEEAVTRLEEAVVADSKKHDAHWWLGNAQTTQGFQSPDAGKAGILFEKAAESFRKAIKEDPENEAYKKSLEVSLKGPELHLELQKQMALQQAITTAVPPGQGQGQGQGQGDKKKKPSSEFWYDIAGWVILTVGAVAWLSILSARAPPPPPASK